MGVNIFCVLMSFKFLAVFLTLRELLDKWKF